MDIGAQLVEQSEDRIVKRFDRPEEYATVRDSFQKLSVLQGIPKHTFIDEDQHMIVELIPDAVPLNSLVGRLEDATKQQLKAQVINFVRKLNQLRLAHRDLHVLNILVKENQIWVIDWEFLTPNNVPLEFSYDLTGTGLESPRKTGRTNIFKKFRRYPSVAEVLGITRGDFKKSIKLL